MITSEPITTSDPGKPLITGGVPYKAPAASAPTAVEAPPSSDGTLPSRGGSALEPYLPWGNTRASSKFQAKGTDFFSSRIDEPSFRP